MNSDPSHTSKDDKKHGEIGFTGTGMFDDWHRCSGINADGSTCNQSVSAPGKPKYCPVHTVKPDERTSTSTK